MSVLACPPRRAAAVLALASVAVQLPFLDRGLSLLDEGSILAIADGLARGEVLYLDRVTPLAPLTYELLGALFRVFGTHLLVARVLELAVFSASALFTFGILRRVLDARAAWLGGLAFLALKPLGFPLWTIVNYSQLAMLACLGSLFATVRFFEARRPRWLLAAGLGIGLAAAAKQNLGALVAALVAAGLALDAGPAPRALAVRASGLLAGALPVAAGLAGLLAARGSLGAFLERAVLGPLSLAPPYRLGPPLPDLWSLRPEEMGPRLFAYFPSPVFGVILERRLPLASQPFALAIELFVEAVYYLPLLGFALGLSATLRAPRGARAPAGCLVGFGALAWASMLYRADWTHLMNVYPAVILAASAALAGGGARPRWLRRAGAGCLGLWLAAGLGLGALVIATHGERVETPRGRLRGLPASAAETRAVLEWAAGRPRAERVAFVRAEPLHAFLAQRPLPLRFDLLLPGIVGPEDDAEIARALGGVDRVVYNRRTLPTVPSPLPEYAPRASRRLARGFRLERRLGRDSLVLARRPEAGERTSGDLWERLARSPAAGSSDGVEPRSWLFYRVLALRATAGSARCFELPHEPRTGEALVATPLVDPERWEVGAGRVRFELEAGARQVAVEVPASDPTLEELRLPLDPGSAGGGLRFCASLPGAPPGAALQVGWGEPRVVATR
jgi:4-amino-4-deoxy-L-arabinose transferase-like glycosyltransferase